MDNATYPVLLITGTIQVDTNMPFVSIRDIDARLKAYFETIKWAIEKSPFYKIVFCENSEYHLQYVQMDSMAETRNKRFEYITFRGDKEKIIKQGKGYGEGELISYALENSQLLKHADYFCKITGRISVENINSCIREIRNYFMNVEGEKKISTCLYCVKILDYKKIFREVYKEVDDENGLYLEHVFYKKAKEKRFHYRCFYELPLLKGISGSTGISYEEKRRLRTIKIINLMCRLNVYNTEILWYVIRKVSAIRVKMRKVE